MENEYFVILPAGYWFDRQYNVLFENYVLTHRIAGDVQKCRLFYSLRKARNFVKHLPDKTLLECFYDRKVKSYVWRNGKLARIK